MSGEITVTRVGDTLVPVAASFADDLREFPEKRQLVITVRLAEEKTDEMRAWLWYLVKKLREAGAWDGDSETLMDHLKIHAGYFGTIAGAPTFGEEITALATETLDDSADLGGSHGQDVATLCRAIIEAGPRLHYVPKSIARGAINHQNMSRLVERIEHYIGDEWGINVDEFRKDRGMAGRGSATSGPAQHGDAGEQPAQPTKSEQAETARAQLERQALHDALLAFGFELGLIDKWDMPGVEGLKGYWEKARATKRIKALYAQAPAAMKALYDLAELNARGLAQGYDDEVRSIAADAVKEPQP